MTGSEIIRRIVPSPACGRGSRAISAFTRVFDALWRGGRGLGHTQIPLPASRLRRSATLSRSGRGEHRLGTQTCGSMHAIALQLRTRSTFWRAAARFIFDFALAGRFPALRAGALRAGFAAALRLLPPLTGSKMMWPTAVLDAGTV